MIPSRPTGHGGSHLALLAGDGLRVDETHYRPGLELRAHQHDSANVCVVLEGALSECVASRQVECEAAMLIAKPPAEVHSDRIFASGARCLNITVDHGRLARIRDFAPALTEVVFRADPVLAVLGRRIQVELRQADDMSPLAIEGLVLELITAMMRGGQRRTSRASPWIGQARDFLHDNFRAQVDLAMLARAVERHPAHLAKQFRLRFGVSIGEYVRRLRVEHVARRLVESVEPLAHLAMDAGFSDQSHMHRVFRARMGVTPAAYRRAHR